MHNFQIFFSQFLWAVEFFKKTCMTHVTLDLFRQSPGRKIFRKDIPPFPHQKGSWKNRQYILFFKLTFEMESQKPSSGSWERTVRKFLAEKTNYTTRCCFVLTFKMNNVCLSSFCPLPALTARMLISKPSNIFRSLLTVFRLCASVVSLPMRAPQCLQRIFLGWVTLACKRKWW